MKVVVTGARGFIGTALLQALQDTELEVVPVGRSLKAGLPDLVVVSDYAASPVGDVLVHLAEERDLAEAQAAGQSYLDRIVEQASRLFSAGYSRIVYISSAAVYGDELAMPRHPQETVTPSGTYARAKLAVEALALQHPTCIVARLGNVYGDGMAANNVLNDILRQVPGDGPIHVRDGAPVRDFVAVEDVAQGLMAMVLGSGNGIFNLGSGIGNSIDTLATLVSELAGQPGRPIVSTTLTDRPSTLVLDIAGTEETFGWTPAIYLRDGLEKLVSGIIGPRPQIARKSLRKVH